MYRVNSRDVIAGLLVVFSGAGAMYHSLTAFALGTASQMGPGYFPALVSGLLMLCGVAILIPALLRAGPMPRIELRPLIWISLSMLLFALLLIPFGLVPAVIGQTIVASISDRKLSWKGSLLLAGCLAFGATLIFKIGLSLNVRAFAWPW